MSQLTIPRALKKHGNALAVYFEVKEGLDKVALIEMFEETYIGSYRTVSEYSAQVLTGICTIRGYQFDFEAITYDWNRQNVIQIIKRCGICYIFKGQNFDSLEVRAKELIAEAKENKGLDFELRSAKSKKGASEAFALRNEDLYLELASTAYELQVEADRLLAEAEALRNHRNDLDEYQKICAEKVIAYLKAGSETEQQEKATVVELIIKNIPLHSLSQAKIVYKLHDAALPDFDQSLSDRLKQLKF